MWRPTVRCLCTAHDGRAHPDAARAGKWTGASSVVLAPREARTVNQWPPSQPGPLRRRASRSP